MWKCHKCGKPVYFAERKQSLGYSWHPECLRCEECGKRVNPGQHAEHKGVPYCHVPCYGALFGPQLFGHGTRVESHKSFGLKKDDNGLTNGPERAHLEARLRTYNQYFEGRSGEVRCREVNGRLILEGSLRIYWGVQGIIHLKENDDQRTVITVRKRNSYRLSSGHNYCNSTMNNGDTSSTVLSPETPLTVTSPNVDNLTENGNWSKTNFNNTDSELSTATSNETTTLNELIPKCITLPTKLELNTNSQWDEIDELLQVERHTDEHEKVYQTLPNALLVKTQLDSSINDPLETATKIDVVVNCEIKRLTIVEPTDDQWSSESNQLNRSMSGPDCLERHIECCSESTKVDLVQDSREIWHGEEDGDKNLSKDAVVLRRPQPPLKTGSTAIRRRPGKRLSRSKVKRRCSINGHFYDRETSFFTPPHGSQTSVWATSLVNTNDVINLMLDKYKVESDASQFALFVVRDNGEQRRMKDDEYPLLTRVLLGPHEEVAKLFLMDRNSTREVSNEVAQFLNFSLAECRAIVNQYYSQEEREAERIKAKYRETQRRILLQIEQLKIAG